MSRKSPASDRIVLKVLSGTQSGAEVALEPGDYTLGAGADDDIHLIDISLKPAHARLRIGASKVEIIGGEGALVSATGVEFPAHGETWFELEPLEIVSAGTTRFALGPVHANWTSLSDAALAVAGRPKAESAAPAGWRERLHLANRWANYGILAVLLTILATLIVQQVGSDALMPRLGSQGSLAALREALRGQPFAGNVALREDVDGSIYATGWVETAVDRRAVTVAAERLSIPLKTRINVRQTMRGEIDTLIGSAKLPITATLSPEGVVRLDGLVLKDEVANQFVERLKTDVGGIADVDNHIRTAKTLIVEIEKLAKKAQIESFVVFRLDNQAVEVNGILPVEKIDAWVGFIQAYSKNFAKDIALRSYVQLQAAGGAGEPAPVAQNGPAISIGPRDANSTDIALDMDRIRRGLYELSDLFVGQKRKPSPDAAPAAAAGPAAGSLAGGAKAAAGEAVPPAPSRDAWQLTSSALAADAGGAGAAGGVAAVGAGVGAATPSSSAREAWQLTAPAAADPAPSKAGAASTTDATAAARPRDGQATVGKEAAAGGGTGGATSKPAAAGTSTPSASLPGAAQSVTASGAAPSASGTAAAGTSASGTAPSAPAPTSAPAQAASGAASSPSAVAAAPSAAETSARPSAVPAASTDGRATGGAATPSSVAVAAGDPPPMPIPIRPTVAADGAPSTTRYLTDAANRLISRWLAGAAGKQALPPAIQATLDRVAETRASIDPKDGGPSETKPDYLPLIATDLPDGAARDELCWPGARLTARTLPTAMFWLDVLSVSQQLSLKTFTLDEQRFLLEAAANPQRVRACLTDKGNAAQVALTSLYLNEALRNPDFIRFVVRDLITTDVDIAGINLAEERFFQTRDGIKHREGTTLDIGRRITAIGELASVLRSNLGYLVVPYGAEVNWKLTIR